MGNDVSSMPTSPWPDFQLPPDTPIQSSSDGFSQTPPSTTFQAECSVSGCHESSELMLRDRHGIRCKQCIKHRMEGSIRSAWHIWEEKHTKRVSRRQTMERANYLVRKYIEDWKTNVVRDQTCPLSAEDEQKIYDISTRLAGKFRTIEVGYDEEMPAPPAMVGMERLPASKGAVASKPAVANQVLKLKIPGYGARRESTAQAPKQPESALQEASDLEPQLETAPEVTDEQLADAHDEAIPDGSGAPPDNADGTQLADPAIFRHESVVGSSAANSRKCVGEKPARAVLSWLQLPALETLNDLQPSERMYIAMDIDDLTRVIVNKNQRGRWQQKKRVQEDDDRMSG